MPPRNNIGKAMIWKALERFGVQGVQFVLQIILARILDPQHYGMLSLMVIFVTLADVFVQKGFNTALIQNKDVKEEDYSSVFWVSLAVAGALYAGLFLAAPWIAAFYEMPDLVTPFRVLCLMLFPGAVNSIQVAKISREMDFKKIFVSNIAGIVISGVTGIALAMAGAGIWALVAQTLVNSVTVCLTMRWAVPWKIRARCDFARIRVLFSYGWKLLVSSLLDTLYQDLRSLVIGKKYDSSTLAYYNRGKQFPQFIINAVNGTVQSVLLPAMSAEQDDKGKVKLLMRNSVMLSSYLIFPMMAGLASVSTALVTLLLTEKWLPCVPYMRIYCFTLAFYPVHTSNLQAINAMGRSDVFLKLELIKKAMGLALLVVAVTCFDSPMAIAMTGVFSTLVNCFVNAYPNKELIDYSYAEQMKDLLPSLGVALAMAAAVLAVEWLGLGSLLTLVIQVIVGVAVYVLLSSVFRLAPFQLLLGILKQKKTGK